MRVRGYADFCIGIEEKGEQAVKKSAVSWLHKGWKDIIEPAIKTGGKYLGLYLSQ